MKLFRSSQARESGSGSVEVSASAPLQAGHLVRAWETLSLDDFGIIGTHHLPLDWLGDDTGLPETTADVFPY